jgi:hypothetical protein
MRLAIEQCAANGWNVENDGAYGLFCSNRDGDRREVRIQPTDPTEHVPLNNTSARGSPGNELWRAWMQRCPRFQG